MSFHITLTTTDATFEKSSNNNHSFKLNFTKPIRLRGEWEVAIVNWISDDDDDDDDDNDDDDDDDDDDDATSLV